MSANAGSSPAEKRGFRHEAWFYGGDGDFVDGAASFVDEGLRAGEPVFVVIDAAKINELRAAIGPDARGVAYADMREVGHNPARIIPAWRRFLAEEDSGRAVRGISEPTHPGRSCDELVECHVHEALMNRAFDDVARDFWLLCPYDASALAADVVDTAHATHPYVGHGDRCHERGQFDERSGVERVLGLPLAPVPSSAIVLPFSGGDLCDVRATAAAFARRAELSPVQVDDFVLGVHEVAANSVRHGPGHGALSLWAGADRLLAEVRDPGRIDDPLIGRFDPDAVGSSGRGLWLANQLFDLVQIRSTASGAVVRMHHLIRSHSVTT
jgi:anti-sigma regulatory factor (Ser/Thr protein kinase)